MYKIKTNGKYVLLIKDLGITLSHENLDGATITDSDYENSVDIKKLSRYITVEKIKDNAVKSEVSKSTKHVEESVENKVFVSEGKELVQPTDVFVKGVENGPGTIIEEAKIMQEVEPIEVKNITETKVEVETEVETKAEVKVENKETATDSIEKAESEVKKINKKNNKSSK